MRKLSNLYQRVRFCMRFGATWIDSYRLITLTFNYHLAIRSKTKRLLLQSDNRIYTIHARYHGKAFPLFFRRQDLSMLYEVWMDQSYRITSINSIIGDVLDIGAHVGFTTLYFWTLLGDTHQYICIEGSEKNGSILKKNTEIISRCTVYQNVVTGDGRQVRFYDEMSGHLHQVHDTLGKLQTSKTINDLISNSKHLVIGICKIDIEGMELELLSTNNQWLLKVNHLFLEMHHPDEYDSIEKTLKMKGLISNSNSAIKYFVRQEH